MGSRPELLNIAPFDKLDAVQEVGEYFASKNFKIINMDLRRPWGFFFYFDVEQTDKFVEYFFGDTELEGIDTSLPLQPKVLVFEPGKMASWQYHHRRAEIWRVITKTLSAVTSDSDEQAPPKHLVFGDVINFTQGMRHRGGSANKEWAAVAEIWQHTNAQHLSDEEDIVRLQDNFGR